MFSCQSEFGKEETWDFPFLSHPSTTNGHLGELTWVRILDLCWLLPVFPGNCWFWREWGGPADLKHWGLILDPSNLSWNQSNLGPSSVSKSDPIKPWQKGILKESLQAHNSKAAEWDPGSKGLTHNHQEQQENTDSGSEWYRHPVANCSWVCWRPPAVPSTNTRTVKR